MKSALRALVVTLAVLSVPVAATQPAPQKWSATERANVALVEKFLAGFEAQKPDARALVTALSDDVVMSFSEKDPPVVGKEAGVKALESILPPGRRYHVRVVGQTFAKGRLVVHYREDNTYQADGSLGPVMKAVGIFVVENGKIKYWKDYES